MKSTIILGSAVLFNLSLLGACGGVSNIGSSDGSGGSAVGSAGAKAMGSTKTGGAPADSKMPVGGSGPTDNLAASEGGTAPAKMLPGSAAAPGYEQCAVDADCANAACDHRCPTGGVSCDSHCVSGQCVTSPGSCPAQCTENDECFLDCLECPNDYDSCSPGNCQMGFCQTPKPVCTTQSCSGLACGTPCALCDVSTASCTWGTSYCSDDGQCQAGTPHCACMTKLDCGSAPPVCYECNDGSCAGFDCVSNKCAFGCAPGAKLRCGSTDDCRFLDSECQMCPSGKCAVQACLQNVCQPVCEL